MMCRGFAGRAGGGGILIERVHHIPIHILDKFKGPAALIKDLSNDIQMQYS